MKCQIGKESPKIGGAKPLKRGGTEEAEGRREIARIAKNANIARI